MSDPRFTFKPVELPPPEPVAPPVPWFWPGGRLCGHGFQLGIIGACALGLHYALLPWSALWWGGVVLGGSGAAAAIACAVFGLRVMERPGSSRRAKDHIGE